MRRFWNEQPKWSFTGRLYSEHSIAKLARATAPSRCKEPALAWYRHALHADWSAPSAIKRDFGTAIVLQDGRAVFNLAGNKYRLVVWVNHAYRVVHIRFIGTHAQYDKINVQTI